MEDLVHEANAWAFERVCSGHFDMDLPSPTFVGRICWSLYDDPEFGSIDKSYMSIDYGETAEYQGAIRTLWKTNVSTSKL